jgi:hypothetical protein
MLQAMYGDKLTSIFTSHAEGVVYAMGPADEARQLLLELITKTDAARTPDARVAGAVRRLSPRPQVVMLLDLPQMFTFSLGMARAMGLPVPPVDLPREAGDLIAAGLYLDDGAIRSELSIPADPIRRTVQAVRAAKARER